MANPMQHLQRFPGPLPVVAQGPATGQPMIGYHRKAQMGKYFAYTHQFTPLAASAVRAINSFSVDGSYDFLIQKIATSFDNGGVLLQTQLSPNGELFEFAPVYGSGWGSGQRPEVLGIPESLSRNCIFTMLATDAQTTPLAQNVLVAYHGTKVARQPIVAERYYPHAKAFKYPATFDALTTDNAGNPTGPIPAAQSRIVSLPIDAEGDFDVHAITAVSDTPISIQIVSDSDSWFLSPLRSDLLGGSLLEVMPVGGQFSGEWPFILPAPRLITAAGYLQVTVANLDQVNPTRAQIVFRGYRLYPGGGVH